MEYQIENVNKTLDFRSRPHLDWYMPSHLHEFSELLYCKRGRACAIVNGKRYTLEEKQLIWIPPNFIHEYQCKGSDVVCAVFSNDFIPLFFIAQGKQRIVVKPIDIPEMAYVLDSFYELTSESHLTISGYLNLICAKVVSCSEFEEAKRMDEPILQKVIMYISENYTEDITLGKIAKKFGYNEKYLSNTLHNFTKTNFNQFVAFYRIERAKMIISTQAEKRMASIAYECGFSSINTFNRTFKKITGVTPMEYKNKFYNS